MTAAPTVARTRASAPATTTAPASTPAVSTPPTPTSSSTFVPMQTATGGEFLTPSGNIECQISSLASLAGAYCQTTTPALSVTMNTASHYTVCTGQQCLANAGDGAPTLFYGMETGVGPFPLRIGQDRRHLHRRWQGVPHLRLRHHAGALVTDARRGGWWR